MPQFVKLRGVGARSPREREQALGQIGARRLPSCDRSVTARDYVHRHERASASRSDRDSFPAAPEGGASVSSLVEEDENGMKVTPQCAWVTTVEPGRTRRF